MSVSKVFPVVELIKWWSSSPQFCLSQAVQSMESTYPREEGYALGDRANISHFLLHYLIMKCAALLALEIAYLLCANEWDVQVLHHSHCPKGKAPSAASTCSEESAEKFTFCVGFSCWERILFSIQTWWQLSQPVSVHACSVVRNSLRPYEP